MKSKAKAIEIEEIKESLRRVALYRRSLILFQKMAPAEVDWFILQEGARQIEAAGKMGKKKPHSIYSST